MTMVSHCSFDAMKMMQTLFLSLLASAAFVLAASADDSSIMPVVFPKLEINGYPARMFLTTSVPGTGLIDPLDKHLKLKGQADWVETQGLSFRISDQTPVKGGGQTFMAPILSVRLPLWARVLSHLVKIPVDGVVGWPEVRDNILVFDSAQHTIRRAEQLPPETSGWLKLKVVPDDSLLLELPLPDGEMGTLGVDTCQGGSTAIMMSADQWKEWKSAHSHPGWAEEIKLGALTLTDVKVKEMSTREENSLLDETPRARAAWKLGMAALTRMDLVVDAQNGWAYLHPKPPQTKTKAPIEDVEWKVAENVRLSSDNLFVYSGIYKWFKNDLTGAEADFTHSLELNRRNADAYSERGAVREVLGDFSNAVSNYDKVIELRPSNSEWERLYRQALLWRLGHPAQEAAKPVVEEKKNAEPVIALDAVEVQAVRPRGKARWVKTIGLFLRGTLDETELLAEARKSEGSSSASEQKAQADYYIGMMRLSKGDQPGARAWFKKCVAAGIKDDCEYNFADAELARMTGAKPR
jgi:tetratricopeptide (TPR) repeat protein